MAKFLNKFKIYLVIGTRAIIEIAIINNTFSHSLKILILVFFLFDNW